ncbi:MAG TPA: hypothetical protein V6C81_17920 [Planktothrix sp.]|jgi:hypothetical protein
MFDRIAALIPIFRSFFFYFRDRRRRRLEQIEEYHERLRSVISELLAKADEVDQQGKYLGVPSAEWTHILRAACSELVKLGDDLPKIEKMLEEQDLNGARDTVLESCRKASKISRQLDSIRLNERRLPPP